MTDHLEDLIAKEANRQGKRMTADSLRQTGIDLAGAVLTDAGLIHLPNRGTISAADYVRSLHSQMPESFSDIADDTPAKTTGTLTERYAAEIAASRKSTIDATNYIGLTHSYIEENNQRNNR